ncbi:MAG: SpoIIE family protein phosphatase [Saprospiraceae bacterium]|nr:SpoIIE family protein phosphatase [Saprospiraceae bacterium]
MSDLSKIKVTLKDIEALERELNLRKLQINGLLNITQAINNNVPADGLFNMYHSFLKWEIGVKKMGLFIKKSGKWVCATSIGISEKLMATDLSAELGRYTGLNNNLDESENPLIREFDVVIPVLHKEQPIAYAFIGGFGEEDDMYNKVQFIITITNIISVAIENKRLFKRQLEQERMKREMELASEMQRMLIPVVLPKKSHYEMSSIYQPQLGVGGDYFDYIEFADGNVVFCVGDVSGKGVAAALLMANFQANFHTLINKRSELDAFIRDLNQSVNLITQGDRFITFFIAEYNPATRLLKYVNAGHNPPVLIMFDKVHLLKDGCPILGYTDALKKVEVGYFEVEGEATVLCYTDGLTDIRDSEDNFLEEELLYAFAQKHYRLPALEFNQKLVEFLQTYNGGSSYPDDFTVLTCRLFKPVKSLA